MNIKKLSILFCLVFMVMSLSAMNYQIKVLNTPTITINGKELKIGDWFDDQAIITWGKESQAMRVLSEDNRVYTLSAKLCKEIKAKKFSDFIFYTKPLAARGNDSLALKEALEEKFDNSFIMLDEIVIDLSGIELPQNLTLYFTIKNNEDKKGKFIISKSTAKLKREVFNKLNLNDTNKLSLNVYIQVGQDESILVTDHMDIEILPLNLDFKQAQNIITPTILNSIDSLLLKAEIAYRIDTNDTLACKFIEQAMSFYEDSDNTKGIEYAKLLSLWCQYGCNVFMDEAVLKGEEALQVLKTDALPHEYAECLSSLAYCYCLIEDSLNLNKKKSLDYCLEAIQYICPREHGEIYVEVLWHMSKTYIENQKYQKAFECADKCAIYADSCINIVTKQTTLYARYCEAYSKALHYKALALYGLGKYIDCLANAKMNQQFSFKTWGKTYKYARETHDLAGYEEKLGYLTDAFNHYLESLNILEELNLLTPDYEIELLCYMIDIEIKLGSLFTAKSNYGWLISLTDKYNFDNNDTLYETFLNTAVKYWLYVGDLRNAHYYLSKSYNHISGYCIDDDIHVQMLINAGLDSLAYKVANTKQIRYDELFGNHDFRSIQNLTNVVKASVAINDRNKADSCAVNYVYGMTKYMRQIFPTMSSGDRELFLKMVDMPLFQYIPSYLNFARGINFSNTMYDLTLLHKGLLLRSEQELSILANNNKESSKLYFDILANTAYLKEETNFYIRDSISNVLQQQHLYLQKLIPEYEQKINQYDISWINVRNSLRKDEAAIEFIDIIDYNTGNRSCKALVLINDCEWAYYVDLFNEIDLKNIDKEDYYTTPYLFALIWDPIIARILQYEKGVKKVYFSPSGMISQIALESLIDYQGKLISDEREFYRLSSTRELVNRDKNKIINKAVVYGGLKYDAEIQELAEVNKQIDIDKIRTSRSTPEFIESLSNDRAGMHYLPATKIEAELIDSELQNKGIQSTLLKDIKGTEESFISLNRDETNILHIATHGFYWSQSELDSLQTRRAISLSQLGLNMNLSHEEKALTRSGLFLSGANIALSGKEVSSNICDGILTAHEISKLNFNNLDLAVLSACETGLGDIKSGEGVLGLQRGFKKAGAKSILMSLWKVDDDATQMLMVEFYKNFLNGETKARSLLNAQQYVKSQQGFEDPEYWAGFVLLDALN